MGERGQARVLSSPSRGEVGIWRTAIAGLTIALLAGVAIARAEEETVGIWIKNTAPSPVVVTVDRATACTLAAPVFGPCHDPLNKESKTCTTNNFAISCVTSVKASGADINLTRGDGIAYKLRARKGINMYLCVEAKNLTDCFGKKLQ